MRTRLRGQKDSWRDAVGCGCRVRTSCQIIVLFSTCHTKRAKSIIPALEPKVLGMPGCRKFSPRFYLAPRKSRRDGDWVRKHPNMPHLQGAVSWRGRMREKLHGGSLAGTGLCARGEVHAKQRIVLRNFSDALEDSNIARALLWPFPTLNFSI